MVTVHNVIQSRCCNNMIQGHCCNTVMKDVTDRQTWTRTYSVPHWRQRANNAQELRTATHKQLKLRPFWYTAPSSIVGADRRFRGAY
jgi:hypothetical protein